MFIKLEDNQSQISGDTAYVIDRIVAEVCGYRLRDIFERFRQSCLYTQRFDGDVQLGYPLLANVTQFSIEELIRLETTFWSLNQDHTLPKLKCSSSFKALMAEHVSDALIEAIFNTIDTDHDNEIDFEDFVIACDMVCRGYGDTCVEFVKHLIEWNRPSVDTTDHEFIKELEIPEKRIFLKHETEGNDFDWLVFHVKQIFLLYFLVPPCSTITLTQTVSYWLSVDKHRGLRKDEKYCAIDAKWLHKFLNHQDQHSRRLSTVLAFAEKVRQHRHKRLSLQNRRNDISFELECIDNGFLVNKTLLDLIRIYEKDESYIPMRDVILHRDFEYVPHQVWKYLMSIYGVGPCLLREVVDRGSGETLIESHKVIMKIYADVHSWVAASLSNPDFPPSTRRSLVPTRSDGTDKSHVLVMIKAISHFERVHDLIQTINDRLNCTENKYRLRELRGERVGDIICQEADLQIYQLRLKKVCSIFLEVQNPDGSWPKDESSASDSEESEDDIVGLANLGNTCYMNSMLQCLIHTSELTNELRLIAEPSSNDFKVIGAYCDLVDKMTNRNLNEVSPTFLKDLLSEKYSFLGDHEQHDALEFLSVMLEAFNSELKSKMSNEQTTIVNKLFQGKLSSTFACKTCQTEHFAFETFTALTLPVISKHQIKANLIIIHQEGERRIKQYELIIQDYCNLSSLVSSVIEQLDLKGVLFYRKTNWFFKLLKNPDLMVSSLLKKGPLYGFETTNNITDESTNGSVLAYNRVLLPKSVGLPNCSEHITKIVGWPILIELEPGLDKVQLYEIVKEKFRYYLSVDNFDFRLSVVNSNTMRCSSCKWNEFCVGHEIGDEIRLTGREMLVIDWDVWVWYKSWRTINSEIEISKRARTATIVKPTVSLNDCLGSFLKWETLDETIYCEKCGSRQTAERKYDICELPPILVIHLNRFEHLLGKFTRSDQPINFKLENFVLNSYNHETDKYVEEKYELYGLTCHYGTFDSGHYIAYTKSSEDHWTMYNDDVHKAVTASSISSLQEPSYIFFYKKSTLKKPLSKKRSTGSRTGNGQKTKDRCKVM